MSTIATLTSSENGANSLIDINTNFSNLNTDKAETSSPIFTGTVTIPIALISGLTASEIVASDGSKNLQSLAVATYPSLTELTYVKGVTSAIQTQLGTKQATITTGATDNAALRADGVGGVTLQSSPLIIGDVTSKNAILDFSLLASTDKTFTFPNLTGTFALLAQDANFNTLVANTNLNPDANDGAAIGTTALSWSDLFLASGAVTNYANSNLTVTHSSGLLTQTGNFNLSTAGAVIYFGDGTTNVTIGEYNATDSDGLYILGRTGTYVAGGAFGPKDNDGVALGNTTRQWSDLFLAEGGVINWDNGDATLTQVGNNVTLAGAALTLTGQSGASAYQSTSSQSINQNTFTKVVLDAEAYDTLGEFSSNRFTATVAGTYAVTGQVFWLGLVGGDLNIVSIYKNNASYAYHQTKANTGDQCYSVTDFIQLAVNDYVELYCYQNNASAKSLQNGAGFTYMSIVKIA